jgi:hypothetical protein
MKHPRRLPAFCARSTPTGTFSVRRATDSLFQQRFSEIDEETEPEIEQTDVGEDLFAFDGGQPFDGLELDEKAAVDDEVSAESFVESHLIKADWRRLHPIPPPVQFTPQDNFIYGFQNPRGQFHVNLHGSIHHILCDLFDFGVRGFTSHNRMHVRK